MSYAHVLEELRRKLDEKSVKCIFLTYNEHSKAYKLYNHVTKKEIVNKDFESKEDYAWDRSIDRIIGTTIPQIEEDTEENNTQSGQKVHKFSHQSKYSSKGTKKFCPR